MRGKYEDEGLSAQFRAFEVLHRSGRSQLGVQCHILLEDRTGSNDPNYRESGSLCHCARQASRRIGGGGLC